MCGWLEHSDLGPQGRKHFEGLDSTANEKRQGEGRRDIRHGVVSSWKLSHSRCCFTGITESMIAYQSFPGRVPQDETWRELALALPASSSSISSSLFLILTVHPCERAKATQ